MMIFILGGVKGGKSMLAQCAAKFLSEETTGKLYYLATMISGDSEDDKRIARHIKDRENWGFETIEEGRNFNKAADKFTKEDVVLLDSVTAYVQNNIFVDIDKINEPKNEEIIEQIISLSHKIKHLIIVSDYIFSDAIQYGKEVEMYRRILGTAHNDIAAVSDIVIECAYSNMKFWKNKNNYDFSSILKYYYDHKSHLEYKDI